MHRRKRTWLSAVIPLAVIVVVLLRGGFGADGRPSPTPTDADAGSSVAVSSGDYQAAGAAIGRLRTGGAGEVAGYDRAAFGQAWADVDHNGCDTRNDILARDLTGETFRDGSDCVVVSGVLSDPYTLDASGQPTRIDFTKANASAVQIDHVVPLKVAWDTGAAGWTADKRRRLANDPDNLLAVSGPTNSSKGDKTPAAWMPPNKGAWCAYAVDYVTIADRYGLSVAPADLARLRDGLTTCRNG
ncbi:HNH endonuclease family protein [Raineyella sp. LH-20]|uniref:HNH endonuclease family protein n=1 Tax=Raineyella sp. LH-20 TaxID=3081204 RepID=UPI0029548D98|nr:HNH endonuclease family protein [Raineyella sp. LH-20]WOP19546.1 HNH endonuclease family protein [Raineyella sp. LH-20]